MHELSLARAIQETVLSHAEGRPVRSVQVRLGHLRQVVPESLRFYFGVVCEGTVVAGAELEMELVPALLRCTGCGTEWDPAPRPAHAEDELLLLPRFRCPECSEGGAEVIRGEEFELESIVVEEGSRCIAPR